MAISATSFISNNSNAFGGGLGVTATLRLTNSDFFSNTTTAFGGGLYAGAPTQIAGGKFNANRTGGGGEGGGLYANDALTVSNATFANNFASFSGGGVMGSFLPVVVFSSTFAANQIGTFDGGGLETIGPLWVSHTTFVSHTTPFGGSGILVSGPATILDSTFLNNKATGANCSPACSDGRGGAIKAFNALTVTNSTFVSNTARLGGGAIAADGPLLVMLSELDGNVAGKANDALNPGRGGAIFASRGLTLNMTMMATNSATVAGGGLDVTGTVLVLNSNILSNTAQNGGGMRINAGTAQVAGSLLAGNVVTGSGAALSVGGSDVVLVNDTFADRAANTHEAVSATNSNLLVNNTLFANHAGSVLIDMSTLLTYSFDLFFNTPMPNAGADGGHNLSADPLFVDAADGNFRLTLASPALDAGQDAAVPSYLTVDLDGTRRIADLPGVGVVVSGVPQRADIGAYEYQPPTLFLPFIVR
jgi:predicted outer membrane repeat protein